MYSGSEKWYFFLNCTCIIAKYCHKVKRFNGNFCIILPLILQNCYHCPPLLDQINIPKKIVESLSKILSMLSVETNACTIWPTVTACRWVNHNNFRVEFFAETFNKHLLQLLCSGNIISMPNYNTVIVDVLL